MNLRHSLMWIGGVVVLAGCTTPREETELLDHDARLDPSSCASCHPAQYREWSGSMHAYAAEDPVFRAMNAYGQRVTDGALGDFCVQCHAPVALAEGATTNGNNLDTVAPHLRGVTCTACHQIDAVDDDHNNMTTWIGDAWFRGALERPMPSPAHGHQTSALHDRDQLASASLCGSCHDVVTPAGIHLERTYLEWQNSQYSVPEEALQQTCGSCHMPGRAGTAAAVPGAPERRIHNHSMPGVDIALTEFPEADVQRSLVQDALDSSVWVQLEVYDYGLGTGITVALDNIAAGHGFPSGAAHDRRAWVEVVARDEANAVIWSSGTVEEDEPLREVVARDPDVWWLGDWARRADGTDAHTFWEVDTIESSVLVAPSRFPPNDPRYEASHVRRTWDLTGLFPSRVDVAIHIRPVGLDVLDVLIASGDLDPIYRTKMPTFTLDGSRTTWTAEPEESEGE